LERLKDLEPITPTFSLTMKVQVQEFMGLCFRYLLGLWLSWFSFYFHIRVEGWQRKDLLNILQVLSAILTRVCHIQHESLSQIRVMCSNVGCIN
jgi:hypothetical protein